MEELTARDIMVKSYVTIAPDAPIHEAGRLIVEGKVRDSGYKPFGIIVTDEIGRLVGMISMFDILYHLRPAFLNYEIDTFKISKGELEPYVDQFKELKVEQVMSTPVVTVSPDDDLIILIDLMVKKKFRRLPVVDGDKILGIVYLSDVFYRLYRTWSK